MDAQKVDMFMMSNAKFFEPSQFSMVRDKLLSLEDSSMNILSTIQFRDPTQTLIISILVGSLGIDRFIIGSTGIGIFKLLTCGGFGIWTIVDWFIIQKATRDKNMQKLQQFLF